MENSHNSAATPREVADRYTEQKAAANGENRMTCIPKWMHRLVERFMPWWESRSEQSKTDFRALFAAAEVMTHAALAGASLTFALFLLAIGSEAGKEALAEMKHHLLYVPPIVWALVLVVVSAIAAVGDSEGLACPRKLFLDPLLSFAAHIFAASCGGIPVLWLAKLVRVLDPTPATSPVFLATIWGISFLVSAMASLGLVLKDANTKLVAPASRSFAFLFFLISLVLLLKLSTEPMPAQKGLEGLVKAWFG